MNPRSLLRLEGAAVLIVSLLFYHWSKGSWLQFALLFLLPDLSMLGYAAGIRVGAITYNVVHTYVGPLVLAAYSFGSNRPAIVSLSLIWIAHIGFDRMLGFGLKYPTRFNDTQYVVWELMESFPLLDLGGGPATTMGDPGYRQELNQS